MCGIGGIRRFGQVPITDDQIALLFFGLQHRGMDASGIAIMNGENLFVHKLDKPAWEFVASREYKSFMGENLHDDTDIVLVHTRAYTEGSPRVMKNNHPMFSGGTAVVHNGCISNHRYLFENLKLARTAETDSDIIRAILDDEGFTNKAVRVLERMAGSAAIAAVSPRYPGELLLARSGNPLVLAADDNHMYWASEKGAIHAASRPWKKQFNLEFQKSKTDLGWLTMPQDTAYFFGPEGLQWHQEFKVCTHFKPPNYARQFSEYDTRNTRLDIAASNIEKEITSGLTCGYGTRTLLTEGTSLEGEHTSSDLEDHSQDVTVEDARTLIQCESCEQWNFTTEEAGEVDLSKSTCGHCGRKMRGIVV